MTKTEKTENYEVKDMSLAELGHKRMAWAASRMPVLQEIKERFKKEQPFKGVTIGACLHVTKETSQLCEAWLAGGATVYLAASNPLSTQDDVAAALAEKGVHVFAWKGMDTEGYYRSIANVIAARPQVTVDDGADLVGLLHKLAMGDEDAVEVKIARKVLGDDSSWIEDVWAGCEETTTGVIRLRAMEKDGALMYPILATNDTPTKWEFDNIWGTGQSTWDGIIRATGDLIASKVVVVAGYGHCGRGVAIRARGLGARRVIVTEINPHRALTAAMEGFEVMPMEEAASLGDIFVTATGCKDVIRKEHFEKMKDGVIVANTGHFNVEISIKDLETLATSVEEVKPLVDAYQMPDGRRIFLLAQGRLVNLSCAEGHPSEVMQMSFGDQALATEYIVKHKDELKAIGGKVLDIPPEIDEEVARLACKAIGLKLETLTPEQERYLRGWQEGTV